MQDVAHDRTREEAQRKNNQHWVNRMTEDFCSSLHSIIAIKDLGLPEAFRTSETKWIYISAVLAKAPHVTHLHLA